MKIRLSIIFTLMITFLLSFSSTAIAALKSVPAPKLPTSQNDFDTDLFTGSASYAYPIKVPPGTNGLTPDVTLSYNSSGAKDGSQRVGSGWQMSHDFIERDVNFTPDASNTGDDKFILHFKGQTHDLIYTASESAYHTKIESHLRIKNLSSGGDNAKGAYWEVTDTAGTKYRFGYQNESELVCNGRDQYVTQWNLDLVTDTHNNKIFYTYTESDGVSYPSTIKYNTDQAREIIFNYSANASKRWQYSQGCKVREASKLNNVKVKTSGNVVREFYLKYSTAINNVQLLNAITEKGSTTSASLPPTKFSYYPEIKGWPSQSDVWIDSAAISTHLAQAHATLADVNGDALPDIVRTQSSGGNHTWEVLLNQGSSWATSFGTPWVNNQPFNASLNSTNTRLVDVTGDNRPDIVKVEDSSGNMVYTVYKNTGNSWDAANGVNWATIGSTHDADIRDNHTNILDLNGDNLPEIVKSQTGDSTKWKVFKNTGSNWNTSPEEWTVPTGLDLTMNNLQVIDVNGDSLQDIITTSVSGLNTTWNVYRNTGYGWDTTADQWINASIGNGDLTKSFITLADVNGDGLPDIVRDTNLGTADKWEVLLNLGSRWSTTWQIWIDTTQNVNVDSQNSDVRVADVNGDGLADIVRGKQDDCGGCNAYTWEVWSNKGKSTGLLSGITTSLGGLTSFEYASTSAIFDNTGSDTLPDLPFGLQPVKKMTVNNGMTGAFATTDVTTYSYQDGLYDWEDREFRGFATVDITQPNTSKMKYVFHQSDSLQGLPFEVQTRDSSNNPYFETESSWSSSSNSGIFTVKLDEEREYTYDGSASNPKVKETEYLYDIYGNVTKKSELGDTSLSGDERFTHTQYVASESAWIVSTPKKIYVNAANDSTKVSETTLYYDGHTNIDAAPTKGDVTKEVKWLSGGSNPETEYEYDSYGNVTKIIDPNDNETTYTFNVTDWTRTYPERITNAKGQQTTILYDLGTGNILKKTDPNGVYVDYEYDIFGRFAKEVKPYDTNPYPTVFYEYDFDGVAPEIIRVRLREEGGNLHAVDTHTYIDGLNRKVQTRADAEDPTKQIVIDTYYDATGAVKKESVPYLATSSATLTSPSMTKFGDGSDGNLTVTSNIPDTPIDSSVVATAGTALATVGSGLGFAANQIVLFHQTQGDYAGVWEFARVQSYSGTTLTLTTALANSYSSSGNNHAQVRVVPQYNNVTVNSGVTWTAKAWNGTTGGILAFLAKGTVTVNGTITATGKGFRGGNGGTYTTGPFGSNNTANRPGYRGEGINGDNTTKQTDNNGNGAGGGGVGGTGTDAGGGGGGGGHASIGSNGTNDNQNPVGIGGAGGGIVGSSDLSAIFFGGGGGGGGLDDSYYGQAGNGGAGGGIVFISGSSINTADGIIVANGANGASGGDSGGGGGGGAGGAVKLLTQVATLGSDKITLNAGGGASGNSAFGGVGGNGGAGSSGRISVEYETSVTGSTTPAADVEEAQMPFIPPGGTEYASFDPDMEFSEWTYDPLGRVSIITDTKGDDKTIAYDHWKETEIDENGHIKRRYLNAYGKIAKVEEVIGVTSHPTNYIYNTLEQLTQIIDSASNSATITYDTLGRKTAHDDPDMGTWTYGYDAAGNQTSTTDARSITTNRTYDELNRLTLINYPNDTDSSFAYDLGKIGTLSIATDSAGTVFYTYDDRLRKIEETRVIGGTSKTTEFEYDRADRLMKQTNPDATVSEYTFNNQGEIETLTGILSDIDYNALGKITEKTFNNGLTTTYTYNTTDFRLNRIQTGSLQDLHYTYDPIGNITSIFNDITDKTQYFTYDDLDRLKTATESAGFSYAYEYNPIGNLTKFANGGVAIDYSYGENAGPHAVTASLGAAPAASNSGSPYGGTARAVTSTIQAEDFDLGGEGVGYHDSDSSNNGNTYRTSEGVDISEYTSGQYNVGWNVEDEWRNYTVTVASAGAYTFNARVTSPNNNSKFHAEIDGVDVTGQMEIDSTGGWNNWVTLSKSGVNLTAGTHILKVVMDERSTEEQWVGDFDWFSFTFNSPASGSTLASYTYDANGNMTSDGLKLFEYNEANKLKKVKQASDSATIAEYVYDYKGQRMIKKNYTSGALANTVISWSDSFETKNINGGGISVSPIVIQAEDYNTGGEGVGYHDADSGNNGGAYRNDDVDMSEFSSGQYNVGWGREGEWLKYNFTATVSGTFTFNAKVASPNNNSKIHAEIDGVDVTGAMTINNTGGWGVWQTISKTGINISAGSHVLKVVMDQRSDEEQWVGDMDLFEFVYEGGSTSIETTNYFFANGELVAKKNNDGSKVYFHNDHLGSTTLTTNQAGAQVEVTSYDPWGKILGAATQSKFMYTGQEHDSETGLHYYDARYYDPELKRFTQPDTIIPDVYNPQALNRYSYALNNPLKYTDPSGHWSIKNIFTSAVKAVQSAVKAVSTAASSIVKTVKAAATVAVQSASTFVSSVTKSQGPPPVSTYNLPNNIPKTQVNLPSSSSVNSNGSIQTPTTTESPLADYLKDGYTDVSVSVGKGPISGGGGVKLDSKGVTQYIAGGPGFDLEQRKGYRQGITILVSKDPVQERTLSHNFTISAGITFQFSYDPSNITKIQLEAMGIGCCGVDWGPEYTGKRTVFDSIEPQIVNYRSKELNEIYGK